MDFKRPALSVRSSDVLVPIHPKVNDMLEVAGNEDEVWFGHVMTVDVASRTCQIRFYISDETNPSKYKPETAVRGRYDILHWDSILGVASGYWNGNFWYILN